MALAYWRDECKVNHPQIDYEHHHLFQLLEGLYRSVLLDHDQVMIQGALDGLFSAMMEHCETEEALMEASGYPGRSEHIDQHEAILGIIFNHRLTLERGLSFLTLDDVYDMAIWFTSHVGNHDLRMMQYVQQQQKRNGVSMSQHLHRPFFAHLP